MPHSHYGRGGCCRCCIKFIVTLGITALFMWLVFRVSNPICSIQYIYIPALDKTANSTSNTTFLFDLKLDNPNWNKGIYYDDIQLNFYYVPNRTISPIGNMTIQHFYQGKKKKARRKESVETHRVPWEAVSRRVSSQTVVFRVDLATTLRFKIVSWKTKRHKLVVGAEVEVNDLGNKVEPKGIKLTSGVPELRPHKLIIFVLLYSIIMG